MITVTVYTTGSACMQCRLTRQQLTTAGIPFTEIDLTENANSIHRDYVTDELGYSQAPVVVVDSEPEHHWSGFRPDLIARLARAVTQPVSKSGERRHMSEDNSGAVSLDRRTPPHARRSERERALAAERLSP